MIFFFVMLFVIGGRVRYKYDMKFTEKCNSGRRWQTVKEKKTGTFLVKILKNENSTWQGSVTWVESQKTVHFRSALELLKMIDKVITRNESEEIEGGSHEE